MLAAMLQQAMTHHRAGHLPQAIALYRRIVAKTPNHADAQHLLGMALSQAGQGEGGLVHLRRACTLAPGHAVLWFRLGCAEQALGQIPSAIASYRQVLALEPGHADTRTNLAGLVADPAEALALLAELLRAAQPSLPVRMNGGRALRRLRRWAEAEAQFRAMLAVEPNNRHARLEMAMVLDATGRTTEALAVLEPVVLPARDWAEGWYDLARLYQAERRFTDAAAAYRHVTQLRPDLMAPWNNLGSTLRDIGDVQGALAAFEQGIARHPLYAPIRSNLLMTRHYANLPPPAALAALHLTHMAALNRPSVASPPRVKRDGLLTLAYLSPDLRAHSVGWFVRPVLAAHDQNTIRLIAYSDTAHPDAYTERMKASCALWRNTAGLDDAALAAQIAADGVDVLIDLAGHTAGNRLPMLAGRVAPVQLTWLGYPNITGIAAMDGRLTDAVADPVDQPLPPGETLIRLDGGFLAYAPPVEAPTAPRMPFAGVAGQVVFGSFNHLAKLGAETLTLWAGLLMALPQARLVIKAAGLADAGCREGFLHRAQTAGLPIDRVELRQPIAATADHLSAYNQIDIALDSLPYNGTTTTCEALWMGVPVLTLVGRHHVERVGASLLTALGLTELIADTPQDFITRGVQLAQDPARLAGLHASLRTRMAASPLCDARRVAAAIEAVAGHMMRGAA